MNRLAQMLFLQRSVDRRTLRDVAKEIGIGHATLLRIEQGKAFDVETWMKVQRWLLAEREQTR